MPRRRNVWVWVGRIIAALCVAGLGGYLYWVGLDKADKLGSVIACLIAVAALVAPYALPPPSKLSDTPPQPASPGPVTMAAGQSAAVTGDVHVQAEGGSAAAVRMRDVTVGPAPVDPSRPGRSRG